MKRSGIITNMPRLEDIGKSCGIADRLVPVLHDVSFAIDDGSFCAILGHRGLARALICDPAPILADEPTGSLDSATSTEIIDLFADLGRSAKPVRRKMHPSVSASDTVRVPIGKSLARHSAIAMSSGGDPRWPCSVF